MAKKGEDVNKVISILQNDLTVNIHNVCYLNCVKTLFPKNGVGGLWIFVVMTTKSIGGAMHTMCVVYRPQCIYTVQYIHYVCPITVS